MSTNARGETPEATVPDLSLRNAAYRLADGPEERKAWQRSGDDRSAEPALMRLLMSDEQRKREDMIRWVCAGGGGRT